MKLFERMIQLSGVYMMYYERNGCIFFLIRHLLSHFPSYLRFRRVHNPPTDFEILKEANVLFKDGTGRMREQMCLIHSYVPFWKYSRYSEVAWIILLYISIADTIWLATRKDNFSMSLDSLPSKDPRRREEGIVLKQRNAPALARGPWAAPSVKVRTLPNVPLKFGILYRGPFSHMPLL